MRPSSPGRSARPALSRARRWGASVILGLSLGLATPVPAALARDDVPPPAPDRPSLPSEARLGRFLEANRAATRLPGVAVAVIDASGEIRFGQSGRTADGRSLSPDTPFRVASISKSFTAFAILRLVERGQLSLDRPVADYLPEFATADLRGRAITVRHLLTHTSGMADGGFPEMSRPQPRTLEEAVARLRHARLVAKPGSQWNYHNPNYHVLARLIEVVSGRPYGVFMRDEVFRPLGMTRTTTVLRSNDPVAGLSRGFAPLYGAPIPRAIPDHFVAGSGGVVSTSRDMAKWLLLQLNDGVTPQGQRLISPAGLKLSHDQAPAGEGVGGFGWGASVDPDLGRKIEHGGVLFTFSSQQALYPDRDMAMVLLFNSVTTGGAEQASFSAGLETLVQGRAPVPGRPMSLLVDLGLGGVTVFAALLGVFNIRRSRRWARWWRARPRWLTVARLLIGALPVALLAVLPQALGLLFGGRDVTWTTLIFAWPALAICFAVPAVLALVALCLRARAVWKIDPVDPAS